MTEDQKLTSYFGERKRSGDAFVAEALLELYGRHEIAASIAAGLLAVYVATALVRRVRIRR